MYWAGLLFYGGSWLMIVISFLKLHVMFNTGWLETIDIHTVCNIGLDPSLANTQIQDCDNAGWQLIKNCMLHGDELTVLLNQL